MWIRGSPASRRAGKQRREDRGWGSAAPLAQLLGQLFRVAVDSGRAENVTVEKEQGPTRRSTQGMRLVQYRIEHRGEIAGRGVDDAEHLGRRGLLFERFLRLGDEARVLDRDHRL